MENYIKNYNNFNKIYVYDFKLGDGGIGDYIKFFMIVLNYCICNKIKFYKKNNNLLIDNYIKLKHDYFNITANEISKLKNVTIKIPSDYYYKLNNADHICTLNYDEIFYFDDIVKINTKKILPYIPDHYISIHLRLGDKYLETDKKYVLCKDDVREYSEQKMFRFIEENIDDNIIFFCDNNKKKLQIKTKYKNILITNSNIGHTSLDNTTNQQVLDTVTDFYLLTNSKLIYAVSFSGFSSESAKFKNITYIT